MSQEVSKFPHSLTMLNQEKRQRVVKKLDPEFSQYTSSESSNSDNESDQESDAESDNDPDKLWCVCRKPHGDKFMIRCDVCLEWFHGHCVGVTKLMGDRIVKESREWFCGECGEKLRAGMSRSAIQKVPKKTKKEKQTSQTSTGRRRGRPRKSETLAKEGATRVSQRNLRKQSLVSEQKLGSDITRRRRSLAKSDARSKSYEEFGDSQRLKELIVERKKEFFFKRQLAEQEKAARRSELGLGRRCLTANLSDSLDSLATSTNAPNMNNLPINIKSEHKERSKPNIVLQINTKKESTSDQDGPNSRIVTTIMRSSKEKKHSDSSDPVVNDLFTAEPIQINKKLKVKSSTPSPGTSVDQATGDNASNGDGSSRKNSSSIKLERQSSTDSGEPVTPKKKRKDSESGVANGSSTPANSKVILAKLKESLELRSKQIKDLEVTSEEIDRIAVEIEAQLNECFKEGTQKYLIKFRSLIFNLRDSKNQGFVRNVLTGEIPPARIVRMSSDEMASNELAKWRERENKHSIELIKRDAQLAAQQVIVKKTHKGEEVIAAPSLNDPDDPTAVVDNQEPPTTPTKTSSKDAMSPETSKSAQKTVAPIKVKITGVKSDQATSKEETEHQPTYDESLPFLDTTKGHKTHLFDINCKICTKQITEADLEKEERDKEEREKQEAIKREATPPENESQPEQPKRLRISIDTKLDPDNLSRMKEAIIRSQPAPMDVEEQSLLATTPCETTSNQDYDEPLYDPEMPLTSESDKPLTNEPCWSGTISMPDIAKFSASAKPISGAFDIKEGEIGKNLVVCGRIAPDQVQGYIKKLRTTTKNQIMVIHLSPLTDDDKANFDTFFDYLYSRNRYGVIQTSPQFLKDFYILPIHEKATVPDFIRPVVGPSINRVEQSGLLGLLVRSKKPSSSTSSYTPTPLK